MLPKNLSIFLSLFLSALLLFQVVSCSYFRVNRGTDDDLKKLINLGKVYKFFVIHDTKSTYSLTDLNIDDDYLTGTVVPLQKDIHYDLQREKKLVNQGERSIFHEVHIYLKAKDHKLEEGPLKILLEEINSIHIIEKDSGKSIAAFLGASVATFGLILIIALLTKSSCPYIYTYDGESFVFQGESFGGAILQNLERADYIPLPTLRADDDLYRIRISNELKEKQYTNYANLISINHPIGTQALLDQSGEVQIIVNPQAPLDAKTVNDRSVRSALIQKDSVLYNFNEADYPENEVRLRYRKTIGATKGKLLINAKNTLWFDYLYGEVISKFGSYYPTWMAQQAKKSTAERLETIQGSGAPLSVYVKINDKWELVEAIPTIGPLATRDMVIPVDLTAHQGEIVEVKLKTGFLYWDLDLALMDFNANPEFEIIEQKPILAQDSYGKNWMEALAEDDNIYMAQLTVGEQAELQYPVPPRSENQKQSVFLHTKGYYELIRDFQGAPRFKELYAFKDPTYMMQYSMDLYRETTTLEEIVAD